MEKTTKNIASNKAGIRTQVQGTFSGWFVGNNRIMQANASQKISSDIIGMIKLNKRISQKRYNNGGETICPSP